jgi:uncharacterized protein YaiI (UPF0178 family)
MKLFVDADSCPADVRALIQKRAARERIPLIFAANRHIPFDAAYRRLAAQGLFIMELCPATEDSADDRIVTLAVAGDIAVTHDVPLALRLVEKKVYTLDNRGRIFTPDNIHHYLSLRDFNISLAKTRQRRAYGNKEKKAFADSFDRIMTRLSAGMTRR